MNKKTTKASPPSQPSALACLYVKWHTFRKGQNLCLDVLCVQFGAAWFGQSNEHDHIFHLGSDARLNHSHEIVVPLLRFGQEPLARRGEEVNTIGGERKEGMFHNHTSTLRRCNNSVFWRDRQHPEGHMSHLCKKNGVAFGRVAIDDNFFCCVFSPAFTCEEVLWCATSL